MLNGAVVLLFLVGVFWLALGRPKIARNQRYIHVHDRISRRGGLFVLVLAGAYLAAHVHQLEALLLLLPLAGVAIVTAIYLAQRLLNRHRYHASPNHEKKGTFSGTS